MKASRLEETPHAQLLPPEFCKVGTCDVQPGQEDCSKRHRGSCLNRGLD